VDEPCLSLLFGLPVVRNDRMKKKKEEKRQGEAEVYVLSADTEQMIERVRRAHLGTFPSLGQLGKYTTVRPHTHTHTHTQVTVRKTRHRVRLVMENLQKSWNF